MGDGKPPRSASDQSQGLSVGYCHRGSHRHGRQLVMPRQFQMQERSAAPLVVCPPRLAAARRGVGARRSSLEQLSCSGRAGRKRRHRSFFILFLCLRACISLRKLPKLVQKLGPSGNAYVLYCVHLIQGGWLGKDSAPRLAIVEYLWVQRDSGKDGGHHGRDGAAGSQRRWGANVALRSGLL